MKTTIPSKQAFYIFSNGTLKRKENTIFFIPSANQEEKTIETAPPITLEEEEIPLELETEEIPNHPNRKAIPITNIDAFYVFGEVSFNARFLNFLSQHRIPMHIFNWILFWHLLSARVFAFRHDDNPSSSALYVGKEAHGISQSFCIGGSI